MGCRSAPGWAFLSCSYRSTQFIRIQAALRCKSWNQLDKARKVLIVPYLGAAIAQQRWSQLESNLVTRVILGWSWGAWVDYLHQ